MMRVDYIRVPGREWVPDPDHRFDTVEMRLPLPTLIRRARAAILDDLPKAFSLPPGEIQRLDIPLVPDRVIREAVVNAVMHRSYRVQGAVQIIRYSNRLEIRNPGYSLVAEDRLGEPGSESRNPVLAAVLHDMNLAETKGSGIRVMRQSMDAVGLTPPTFESDRERDRFVVILLFHHFLSPEDWVWLRQFQNVGLSDEEARALVFVRETGAITNAAYRALNHVDVRATSHHLRRLRDRGLLQQKGKGAETYYAATEVLLNAWKSREEGDDASPVPGQPEEPFALSMELGAKPRELDGKPRESALQVSDLPPALSAQISALGRRPTLKAVRAVILRLCDWRPLASGELARLLRRNQTYLLHRFLSPMVREGVLQLTVPQTPTHPEQRYRVELVTEAKP